MSTRPSSISPISPVIVVGSANMDMTVRCQTLPRPGETVMGHKFVSSPGGKGANQAVACAKLGAPTSLVARVGCDALAREFASSYQAAGLSTEHLVIDREEPSGTALIFVQSDGENEIIVAPGANANLSPADVDTMRALFEPGALLLLQLEVPLETVLHAARLAKSLGLTVVLNPAPVQVLRDELVSLVDILIANETEIEVLTGFQMSATATSSIHEAQRACGELFSRGVGHIVATLGSQGVLLLSPDKPGVFIPGFQVEAVDATAAGDTFAGAFGCALAEKKPIAEAARFANAAAALSVTKQGAQISMPSRPAVEAFLTTAL